VRGGRQEIGPPGEWGDYDAGVGDAPALLPRRGVAGLGRGRRRPLPAARGLGGGAGGGGGAVQVDQHRQGLAPALVRDPRRRAGLLEDPPARRGAGSAASRLRGRGRRQADRGGARRRGAPHRIRASQGHTASRSSPLLVASIRFPSRSPSPSPSP
jgi:hypothetical protein